MMMQTCIDQFVNGIVGASGVWVICLVLYHVIWVDLWGDPEVRAQRKHEHMRQKIAARLIEAGMTPAVANCRSIVLMEARSTQLEET
jgi:hypothetical protein